MLWFGFFLRLGLAWILLSSGFYLTFTGDVVTFHGMAREIIGLGESVNPDMSQEITIDDSYFFFIGLIYLLTTDSMYVTSIFSCLAWFFSGYFLIKIMNLLEVSKKKQIILLFIYIFLPSSLLNTGLPLRESYEMLVVNMSIYSSLMWYFERSAKYLFILLLGMLLMTLLHMAMFAFGAIIFISTLFLISISEDKNRVFILFPISGLAISLIYGSTYFYQFFDYYGGQGVSGAGGQLADAVRVFQAGAIIDSMGSRAQYVELSLERDGLSGLLYFLPVAFFQYLFEPMPWRSLNLVDYVLVLENIMRAIFIFYGIKGLFVLPSLFKKIIFFLLVCYLSAEMIWAVGTTNWGTASRHHLPALGILLLLGLAFQDYYKSSKQINFVKN